MDHFERQIEQADCRQLSLLVTEFDRQQATAESYEEEELWELLFQIAHARLKSIGGDNFSLYPD
eukprot:3454866-Prorocentrum_lima.AAC.1